MTKRIRKSLRIFHLASIESEFKLVNVLIYMFLGYVMINAINAASLSMRFSAYIGFINFYDAIHWLVELRCSHSIPDSVKHEPCGLLGHANIPAQLQGRNAFLVRRNEPQGHEPFLQGKGTIFKNCPDAHRKRLAAIGAFEKTTALDRIYFTNGTAMNTNGFAPSGFGKFLNARLFGRKCFLKIIETFKFLSFHFYQSFLLTDIIYTKKVVMSSI